MQLSLKMLGQSYKRLKINNMLPWLMVSVSFQAVAQGQWAQPTALGFGIIMGGLTIAAMRLPEPGTGNISDTRNNKSYCSKNNKSCCSKNNRPNPRPGFNY
jgi:hypothetical protein